MRGVVVLLALALAGCNGNLFGHRDAGPSLPIRYVVGVPYEALGVWRYPRERFTGEETGLATVLGSHGPRATDDEPFDQTTLAAAHPTLQLPALAEVTNLESGRRITVRVNDRGPVPAERVVSLTRRAAELISARDGTRVRVRVLDRESLQLAAETQGDTGKLAVATVPKVDVKAETLPPPVGVAQGRARVAVQPAMVQQAAASGPAPPIPLRLPEQVSEVPPQPGSLYVVAGTFGRLEYAEIQRRRLGGLGARVVTSYDAPRDRIYRVEIGPIEAVADADAMLGRVLGAGVRDASIVVQ